MTKEDLDNRFGSHAANTDEKRAAHEDVRAKCRELADFIDEVLVDGREKATAITKLEEVMFWTNAGVARPLLARAARV